jgi:hypothetical protein
MFALLAYWQAGRMLSSQNPPVFSSSYMKVQSVRVIRRRLTNKLAPSWHRHRMIKVKFEKDRMKFVEALKLEYTSSR